MNLSLLRRPIAWRKAITLWLPIEWARTTTLERLDPNETYDVFSYLPIVEDGQYVGLELIVPSEVATGEEKIQLSGGATAAGRVRHPRAGNVESSWLCRPFAMSPIEQRQIANAYPRIESIPTKVLEKLEATTSGISTAHGTCKNSLLGNFDLNQPVKLTWNEGLTEHDFRLATYHLKDGSYVRVFPIVAPGGEFRNPFGHEYYWPYQRFAQPFRKPPQIGETNECLVRWRMAKDGRPVGYAYPC